MIEILRILGFIGTVLVVIAYIPQIAHLIKQHCTYGISIKAWSIWFIATMLMLPYAFAVQATIFVLLLSIHSVAIAFILIFSYFHQGKFCSRHKIL